ncbi:Adenylosuccinate lyase [Thelohanellus kitauei]|uniref:Adenylosuccinate lyase n=1 Tax=Thelohanellus kitauei TaxID=669202 RepID=A0A0C2JTA4_THEKT|nr:Adenylosuccinate lyase [Thelohanellus kitauei]
MAFVIKGLNVYPKIIQKRIDQEIPFLVVETILIEMVNHGANRSECHEKLRVLSMNAAKLIKFEGLSSQVFTDSIKSDEYFKPVHDVVDKFSDPQLFIGCAKFQVDDYLQNVVKKVLSENQQHISKYSSRIVL